MKSLESAKKVLVVTLISMLLAPSVSLAFSTGATSPTAATGWTNSAGVNTLGLDDWATNAVSTDGGTSAVMQVSGFNFSVPADAVIKGVVSTVQHSYTGNALAFIRNNSLMLMKALVPVGTSQHETGFLQGYWDNGSPDNSETRGSSSNLWGASLSPADINSSGFGLALQASCADCTPARTLRLDSIQLNVFYTLPQIILPSVIPAKTYGDADFDPAYTGGASGNPVTYSSTTPAVCTVVANQIHIVAAGTCTFNANQAGTAGDYEAATQVTTNLSIAQKELTVTGVTAGDKIYDNTNAATLTSAGTVAGRVAGDAAAQVNTTLTGATATFADEHVGAAKTVTVGALPLTGTKAASYILPPANINAVTASIAARPLTVTAQAATKTYDGNTTSVVVPLVTSGVVQAGDTGAFTQTFDTENVGLGKTLTAAGVVTDGNSGNNYTYTFVTNVTGEIEIKLLTEASFANPETEVYDPTNAREFNGSAAVLPADVKIASTDVVSGDDVTFAHVSAAFNNSTVAAGKTVTIEDISISGGADAPNYGLDFDGGNGMDATTTAGITDTTAPTVTITTGPTDGSTQNSADATFEFTVSDAASSIASVECKIDGGAYAVCVSPVTYTGLTEGVHTFYVRATDTSANPGANTSVPSVPSSQRGFTVDLTAPTVTSITSAASNPTNANPIPFTITFSEVVSGLDMLDFSIGNGSVATISAGPASVYTVEITPSPAVSGGLLVTLAFDAFPTVTDIAGNAFAGTASTFSRTYDSVAPTITKTSGPDHGGLWNSATAVFNFTAPGATFECQVNGGGFGPCTDSAGSHTMSGMSDASAQSFEVKATDGAGNSAVLTVNFMVDLTAPNVVLTTPTVAPAYINSSPFTVTATFNEAVTGVDITDFVVTNGTTSNFIASTPTTYFVDVIPSADGLITINLPANSAQDLATNQSNAATQIDVNYDATAPTLVFTVEPLSLANDNTLDFDFTTNDATSGVATCMMDIDGGPASPCLSPFASAPVADGPHTATFVVTDNAGNVLTVVKTFDVDTVAPLLLEVAPVPSPTFPADPRPYSYESSEAGTAVLGGGCSGSGTAIFGVNPISMGTLTEGTYNCTIVVTDGAGNASLPLAMSPFEVKGVPGNGPVTSGGASFPVAGNIQQGGSNGPTQGSTGIAVNIPTPSSPQSGDSTTGGSGIAVTTEGTLAVNPSGLTPPPTVAVTNTGTGQAAGGTPKSTPKSVVKGKTKGNPQVIVKGKSGPVAKSAPKTKQPVDKTPDTETQAASASQASQGFWSWIKGVIFGN